MYLPVISSVRLELRQKSVADYSQRMIQPEKVIPMSLSMGGDLGAIIQSLLITHSSRLASSDTESGIVCPSERTHLFGLQRDLAEITSGSSWLLTVGTFPVGSIVSLLSSALTQSETYNVSWVSETFAIREPRSYVSHVVEVAVSPQSSILGQDHRRR
jgi:hypothetical protein